MPGLSKHDAEFTRDPLCVILPVVRQPRDAQGIARAPSVAPRPALASSTPPSSEGWRCLLQSTHRLATGAQHSAVPRVVHSASDLSRRTRARDPGRGTALLTAV
ncbi:hypothetical protein PsYK624_110320 [Phanerochaete sordida]|uniref:Uncharacterized protein n=1 Tax=Phanerochaete sordida TaxID=48140 RepID=A0A9P3LGT2_9APHY|nr:hypothetical protein PsYK624_110320 [Phanerochaete sordida]